MHLRDPGRLHGRHRIHERALVLGRESDDHVRREVEVLESLELRPVLPDGVPAAHRAEDPVVARLQRHVEMARGDRCLAHRRDQVGGDVVDLDRREPQALEAVDRACVADEPGQGHPGCAVAEAAEVDAGEHDLAMTLRRPAPDLGEHGVGGAAARGAAHERDDAERTREGAAVLDPDEGAHSLEPMVRLDATDRPHVGGDGIGELLAAPWRRRGRCRACPRMHSRRGSRRTPSVDVRVRAAACAAAWRDFATASLVTQHVLITATSAAPVAWMWPSSSSRSRIACSSANETLHPRNRVVKVATMWERNARGRLRDDEAARRRTLLP